MAHSLIRLLAAIAALGSILMGPAAAASLTVMVSYADWCGPCQVLAPKLEEAADRYEGDLETIYLDFTDLSEENLDAQFERASPLTPEDFFEGRYLATGIAFILVDGDVEGHIASTMSVEEILEAYRKAAGQ